ncbi:MAG: sulfotransferase family 2 domain-containing protein [Actinomycetota bacterium]
MGFIDEFHNQYSTGGLQHLTAELIRAVVGDVKFQSFTKFSVVRNPYTKAASQFQYMKTRADLRKFVGMEMETSFEKYLELITKIDHVQWSKQSSFIYSSAGEMLVDHVLRFENFPTEIDQFLRSLDVPFDEIPHLNRSIYQEGEKLLTPGAISAINEIYEEDFEFFGYEKLVVS